MPPVQNSGAKWSRKFEMGKQTADDDSAPCFMEWKKEMPDDLPKGAIGARQKGQHNFILWKGWSGTLIGLTMHHVQFVENKPAKPFLVLSLDDLADTVEIHLPFYGTYCRDFLKRILHPDFSPASSLSVAPYMMKDNGFTNVGISVTSGANKLTARLKSSNSGPADPHLSGIPDGTKVMVQGTPTTDYTAQIEWLWARVQAQILPNLLPMSNGQNPLPHPAPSGSTPIRGAVGPIAVTNSAEPHVTNNAATSAGFDGLEAPPAASDNLPF